ncbi:hypothetical protein OAS27_05640 [Alphaproteobacteria bacterium]|nr:hypothetical protein [Alphaproteobacteria bacterium]
MAKAPYAATDYSMDLVSVSRASAGAAGPAGQSSNGGVARCARAK